LNSVSCQISDVFLTCDDGKGGKKYQIWVNKKEKGFSLSQEGQLPFGTQAISFADIGLSSHFKARTFSYWIPDRDGTIDIIFPSCSHVDQSTGIGTDCFINIAYNQQLSLCSSTTESGMKDGTRVCRRPEALCIADPSFKFDLTDSPENAAYVRFPVSSILPSSSLLVYDTSSVPPLPIPLKLGDADLDGFPDMLAISVQGHDYTPRLLYSVPCAAGLGGCSKMGTGRRGWMMVTKGVEILNNIKDARSLSFLDMDEDVCTQ
jgi:integrin alpha FG-GAP repeat containing protein 1